MTLRNRKGGIPSSQSIKGKVSETGGIGTGAEEQDDEDEMTSEAEEREEGEGEREMMT